jgi:hypothetical protein
MSDIFADADKAIKQRRTIDILARLSEGVGALPKPWLARLDYEDAAKEIQRLRAALRLNRNEGATSIVQHPDAVGQSVAQPIEK